MPRRVTLWTTVSILAILCGCGGKNGLIGEGSTGVILTSITLSPTNPTVAFTTSPAATQQFTVMGTYSVGNPKDITSQVTWDSLDKTVVTVDSNGKATAVNSGRAVVTAVIQDPTTLKFFEARTIVSVVPQLTAIGISPSSAQIAKGTTQQFTATGNYNDHTTADVTSQVAWNSSQPAATVSTSAGTQGLAKGIAHGTASITATLGTVSSAPASLTVSDANLASLAVSPANPTVPLASSQQLIATGTFDDGTKQDLRRDVIWTTVNAHSRVARVSATGMVTGLGLGSETITATAPSSGISSSAGIAVDDSSVAGVSVIPVGMVMFPGALFPVPVMANGTKKQMRAVATFKDGSTLDITGIQGIAWSSTDTSVASVVPGTGLMTTTGPGATTVTAALGSQQGSTSLNVLSATLQSLVVGPNNAQVAQGGIQNVVAVATFLAPDNLTFFQQDVTNAATWSTDANATVNYVNGLQELATGVASGTANLSANFAVPGGSALAGSATLNVSNGQLDGITLVPGSTAVPLDGSRQFLATGNYSDGTRADLSLLATWGSSDDAITTVSPFGFANASGPGQTSISASVLNPVTGSPVAASGSVVVNPAALARIDICAATIANPVVNCPPLDPFPPPPGISFANQTQFGLVAIGTFSDGSRQDLTDAVRWTSDNPYAAAVSNDPGIPGITTGVGRRGVLTGGMGGTAQITATAGGISGSVIVSVSLVVPQSLTVTPANGIVALEIPQQCKVTGLFSDGSKQDVTSSVQWSSLNPDIAIVNPGGLAYSTGKGIAPVSQEPSRLVVALGDVTVTMVNPSTTSVFPWPIGSVFQFHGLTVSSGDVSLLNDTALTILSETDPADSQHLQPCKPGQSCDIRFVPPALQPAAGTYTVTGGTGQASAVIQATMNVIVNSVLTQFSGTTTLTVQ
ncbi:MAG: Ig-like domain-containing protein [Acidobacteriia bacterium]|nr:Ig-like domain-containing protein [Terriglobia bacterium]MBZ5658341.1 Ig-like domain-containing protein [Terriglobia bacterium]